MQKGAERVVTFAGRWAIRTTTQMIQNAADFVTQYDDYMNEIQTVTLKTDAQMQHVSAGLQETANELGVSLNEVASAAVSFYRMGFSDEEVQDRLVWVTKFAKVANVDFANAAKMIITVSNSMSKDIQGDLQRVSDVLLYLGDNSATTAADVAEAMQTLGPVAQAVGIPFEQIATMTAALSDSTQQSASRIGNGLRTLIMRLYAVRNTQIEVFKDFADNGEMEELWEIKNDPAKLMEKFKEAGIELQDDNKQWRDFYSILSDIATLWKSLDATDPKRSALMTILGGQRGGTYISALLDSMNPDTGKYYELYKGLGESFGSTEQKYAIWMESAAAAQERYNLALQNMYSVLDVEVVKSFYDAMAVVANNTATATKNLGGLNLLIPAMVAGYLSLSAAATKAGMTTLTFSNVLTLVRTSMQNHPILAAATIFLTLATTVSVVAGAIINAVEETRKAQIRQYNEAVDMANAAQRKAQTFVELKNQMNDMFESSEDVTAELGKYNTTLENLAKISPTAAFVVDQLKNGLIDQKEAARLLNAELDKTIDKQNRLSTEQWQKALGSITGSDYSDVRYWVSNGWQEQEQIIQLPSRSFLNRFNEYAKKNSIAPEDATDAWRQFLWEQTLGTDPDQMWSGVLDYFIKQQKMNSLAVRDRSKRTNDFNDLADYMWETFSGEGWLGDEYQERLQADVDKWVQTAIGAAGLSDVPKYIQDIFVQKFKETIAGDDKGIWHNDFTDATRDKLLQEARNIDFKGRGRDSLVELMDAGLLNNEEVMNAIYDQIFGAGAAKAEGKQWTQSDEQVKAIAQTYENLIEIGFSNVDIQKAMEGVGTDLWDNPELFDIFSGFDADQMQSVQSMIQDLGWSFLDFYHILSDNTAAAEFTNFLKNTDNELTRLSSNASKDELIKKLFFLQTVSDNISSGQKLNAQTLGSLIQGTPWLLQPALSGNRAPIQKTMKSIDILLDQIFSDEAEALYQQMKDEGEKIEGGKDNFIKIWRERLKVET